MNSSANGCGCAALAGIIAFGGTFALGVFAGILIIRAMPIEVSNSTEAHEGVGDWMNQVALGIIAALVSFVVAVVVALFSAAGAYVWAERREHQE
jgi:hypothetical protein